ncbi:MAG: hypothetical protein KGL39_17355 [Patescibacteria group bacterium]|nr:hypothetical protein [Patescibacteria group bacterium]
MTLVKRLEELAKHKTRHLCDQAVIKGYSFGLADERDLIEEAIGHIKKLEAGPLLTGDVTVKII